MLDIEQRLAAAAELAGVPLSPTRVSELAPYFTALEAAMRLLWEDADHHE